MATTKITVSPPSAGGSYGSRNEKTLPFSRASLQVSEEEEGVGSETGSKSASSPEETSHKKEKLMVNDSACELSPRS